MAGINPGITSLEAWWKLDETSGNRADSHGSNTLTDNNTVLYGAGKVLNAADFELDNSEFLSSADNASLSFADEDFSIGTLIKPETLPGGNDLGIVNKDDGVNREYVCVIDNASNKPIFYVFTNGAVFASVSGASALQEGVWTTLIFGHDSVANVVWISMDGGAKETTAFATGCNDDTADFKLGKHITTYYDGLMDDTFVYRKTLTADNITWLHNGGSWRSYNELIAKPKIMMF